MQLTCGGNDVVRYLVGIGLDCDVYMFYFCFSFTTVLLLYYFTMYYGRFLSEIKLDWLIDWLIEAGSLCCPKVSGRNVGLSAIPRMFQQILGTEQSWQE